jgi:serine/threonine protein kinase
LPRLRASDRAFGLIVLELATGTYPYRDPSGKQPTDFFALLALIMERDAPVLPPSLGFSDELAKLIALSLDKRPHFRPRARDLLRYPYLAPPAPPPPPPPSASFERQGAPPSSSRLDGGAFGASLGKALANMRLSAVERELT